MQAPAGSRPPVRPPRPGCLRSLAASAARSRDAGASGEVEIVTNPSFHSVLRLKRLDEPQRLGAGAVELQQRPQTREIDIEIDGFMASPDQDTALQVLCQIRRALYEGPLLFGELQRRVVLKACVRVGKKEQRLALVRENLGDRTSEKRACVLKAHVH